MRCPTRMVGLLLGVLPVVLHANTAGAYPTWSLVYSEPNQGNAMISLSAVDATHAFAVGMSSSMGNSQPVGIRTMDGVTWTQMLLPPAGGAMEMLLFTSVAFADASNGYLFGMRVVFPTQQNVIWRTTNGGLSWTEAFQTAEMIEMLQVLPTGQLFAPGGGRLWMSSDGVTFPEVALALPAGMTAKGIHMMSDTCGFMVASTADDAAARSAVLWTEQGGTAWETRADAIAARLDRVWFVSPSLGWAAGSDDRGRGVVASTRDGGRTWVVIDVPDHPPPPLSTDPAPVTDCVDVRFFDDLRGVALCTACTSNCDGATEEDPTLLTAFVRTADGGTSWQLDPDYEPVMSAPPFGELMKFSGMLAMAFVDPNHGLMAGQNNLVLRYEAAVPEPAGWGPPSCTGTGTGGSGSGGGSGTGASAGSSAADDADAESDGGCGCQLPGRAAPASPALWLALALGTGAGVIGRRRRHAA